ncbi:hypothetical protein LR021_02410, partial [Candidatus Bipolaricaulota bacterium]|nr:hypothetical protein [Candidatus Bipolaricaulota bacterium]
ILCDSAPLREIHLSFSRQAHQEELISILITCLFSFFVILCAFARDSTPTATFELPQLNREEL